MVASNSPPFIPGRVHIALELEIPSDVRYIERVVEIVAMQCAQFAYPPRQTSLNIPVALS
ncbi:MAG: putative anti sigma factor, partial [Gemmatimonadetes bacterium]|nr:putative anti sigma factor [Gemmatimonadota bacterium]